MRISMSLFFAVVPRLTDLTQKYLESGHLPLPDLSSSHWKKNVFCQKSIRQGWERRGRERRGKGRKQRAIHPSIHPSIHHRRDTSGPTQDVTRPPPPPPPTPPPPPSTTHRTHQTNSKEGGGKEGAEANNNQEPSGCAARALYNIKSFNLSI